LGAQSGMSAYLLVMFEIAFAQPILLISVEQRSDYGKFLKGQTCGMTKERLQKLNSIGFVFYTAKGGGKKDPMMVSDNFRPEIGVNDGEALEAENDLPMVDEDMASNPPHIQRQNLQHKLTQSIHMQQLSAWDRFNNDSGKHLA
jgi:allophanate hydrolase subunit 2